MVYWHSCGNGKARCFDEETCELSIIDSSKVEGARVAAVAKLSQDGYPTVLVLFEPWEKQMRLRKYVYSSTIRYEDRWYQASGAWVSDECHSVSLYLDVCDFAYCRGDYHIHSRFDWRKQTAILRVDALNSRMLVRDVRGFEVVRVYDGWCPLRREFLGVEGDFLKYRVWGRCGEVGGLSESAVRRYRRSMLL